MFVPHTYTYGSKNIVAAILSKMSRFQPNNKNETCNERRNFDPYLGEKNRQ